MSRSLILTLMLSLWISALVVPAVITLMQKGDQNGLMVTLNEEEQQESVKHTKGEKQLVVSQAFGISEWAYRQKALIPDSNLILASLNTAEIILPPPEFIS